MTPPKIAEWILKRIPDINNEFDMTDDFRETYIRIFTEEGKIRANIWYRYQVFLTLFESITFYTSGSSAMFKNYLKIALRNMIRYKGYSFINITGLVIGITCFILIQLWINDELSYDKYHEKSEQIYRIATDSKYNNTVIASASTPSVVARTLLDDYPVMLDATRVRSFSTVLVAQGEKNFMESGVFAADNSFFNVFSFDLIEGSRENALKEPNSIVITKSIAEKYFGNEASLDKIFSIQDTDYKVTGIIEDMKPNSHFHADFIISGSSFAFFSSDNWWTSYVKTYIVLEKGYSYKEFNAALDELVFTYRNPGRVNTEDQYWKWYLQPLTDIHLNSHLSSEFEHNSNRAYVYLFSVISFIILLLACFNFINLTTARTSFRAKEISVRKVAGSQRLQLMNQFLSETTFLCSVSTIIAFGIIKAVLPYFNNYLGKKLSLSLSDPLILLYSLGFVLALSVISGGYPAVVLSSIKPSVLFRGNSKTGRKNTILRNGLVLIQFSISIILIIGVIVVNRQLNFIKNIQLGFDKEQVVIVENADYLDNRLNAFKEDLIKSSSIINVSISGTVPGRYYDGRGVNYEPGKEMLIDLGSADENFINTLNVEMIKGRFFSKDFPSDTAAIVINESALRLTGWEDPLGRLMEVKGIGMYKVIGIVKDHHYESKHQKIWPMALLNVYQNVYPAQYVVLKINTDDIAGTLQMIEETWKNIAPGIPYQFSFLDEDYSRLYRSEEQTSEIFTLFSMLALLIGSLGLFGLASFIVEKRTKEVGIRKAIGSNEINIVYILIRQFIFWPILAVVIAWPVGWIMINRWLQSFEYRISLGMDIFILSGLIAILTAVVSVITQSLKAAYKNPVDSLRYE
ncbi:MAG: FtsX-like permease family protein [bacterium]|nr:FtsX-like permease family protein [bacterium]